MPSGQTSKAVEQVLVVEELDELSRSKLAPGKREQKDEDEDDDEDDVDERELEDDRDELYLLPNSPSEHTETLLPVVPPLRLECR